MGRKPWLRTRYPSFFKILIDDFTNKLQIPIAFVSNFDGEVPTQSILWSPDKKCWPVRVEKSNDKLFFKEGWSQFLKDNGLEFGDLLVFHYAGKSEFGVEFYGKSCCQKRVVTKIREKTIGEESEKRENNRMNESRDNNLDDLSLKVSSEGNIASQTNMVKIEVIDLETEDSVPFEQYVAEENELFEEISQKRIGRRPDFQAHPGLKSKAYEMKVRAALKAANKYIPKHPFFKSVMWKAYATKGFLSIPMSFYKKNLKRTHKKGSTVMFQHSGKSWPVKIILNNRSMARFYSGWGDFVKENAIKLGDVCVFELIDRYVMKVSIFRG